MNRRDYLLIAVSLALILGWASPAHAAETVWGGLVIANNVAQPDAIPSDLHPIEGTLKALFGYNQFKVIGQARQKLINGSEDWVVSSKYFALHIDSQGETETGYLLRLKLFQDKNLILETEAKLPKARPFVIKGPMVGDGQLLLVLVVQ